MPSPWRNLLRLNLVLLRHTVFAGLRYGPSCSKVQGHWPFGQLFTLSDCTKGRPMIPTHWDFLPIGRSIGNL
jgi:hypothetical protein